MQNARLLVNLPAGFYRTPELEGVLARLEKLGEVRRTSHDTPEQIAEDLAWADAVLMWSWPALTDELLDRAGGLEFAAHLDIGQDAARTAVRRGLPVSLGKAAWSPAVAEMALTLTLCCLRRVSDYHAAMRQGTETWVGSLPDEVDPRERQLTGRPVGIVGLGAIGRRLAELLRPFQCDLRVCDPFVEDEVLQRYGGKRADLDELIAASDVVVLAAANNPGTRGLIGRKELDAFRPNAGLVNVARAALVDTDALVERLGDRTRPMWAAIDVFDTEPLPADHPLRSLSNAYLTPHRAGGVMESVQRILNWLIDDLEAHLTGRERRFALSEQMIPALDA